MIELNEANFWIIAASLFALLLIETVALSCISYKREHKKRRAVLIAAAPLPLLGLLFFKPLFLAASALGGVAALGIIITRVVKHSECKVEGSNWIEEEGRKEREKYRKRFFEQLAKRMARSNQ